MKSTLGLLLAVATAVGATPNYSWEYYPDGEWNQWTYSDGLKATIVWSTGYDSTVGYVAKINHLSGLLEDGPANLMWKDGGLRVRLMGVSQYQMLYHFSKPKGTTYSVNLGGAFDSATVTVAEKNVTVKTPAGRFINCIRFDVRKAGSIVLQQWFAPHVGLVKHAHVGHPMRLLKKAKVNPGVVFDGGPESGLYATTSPLGYFKHVEPGENQAKPYVLKMKYKLTNWSGEAKTWKFVGPQKYDAVIKEKKSGKVVYTWSQHQMWPAHMMPSTMTLAPEQKKLFSMTLKPNLAPGNYVIEIYWTPTKGPKAVAKAFVEVSTKKL